MLETILRLEAILDTENYKLFGYPNNYNANRHKDVQ